MALEAFLLGTLKLYMSLLKTIGWFLFILPIFGFIGFSFWMIKSIMADDSNVAAFVYILGAAWIIGLVMLILVYFTDFATLAELT